MERKDGFFIADTARLCTPTAAGGALLWQAIAQGQSLMASPLAHEPLRSAPGAPQYVYCESSGSSGTPKLIRRTPASWQVSFDQNGAQFGIGRGDVYGVFGHLGHSLSLYAATEALHLGAGLALLGDQAPAQQADGLREHQVNVIYATPSQLRLILRTDPGVFQTVTHILCGGGKLDDPLRARLPDHFPDALVAEFFGASETSFITLSDDQTPKGSVGRPYPGVILRIGDGKHPARIGEIWVKSPYLFEGYARGDSPMTRWQDGFLSIGELGWLDAGGYLYLAGRRSRMVTVADQNVFPEAIEAVLLAQPGVEAAAVITPSDPLRGHMIIAAVVGPASEGALRQTCRAALGDAAVPRGIWFVDGIPMLAAGKPDLQKLETLWKAKIS